MATSAARVPPRDCATVFSGARNWVTAMGCYSGLLVVAKESREGVQHPGVGGLHGLRLLRRWGAATGHEGVGVGGSPLAGHGGGDLLLDLRGGGLDGTLDNLGNRGHVVRMLRLEQDIPVAGFEPVL